MHNGSNRSGRRARQGLLPRAAVLLAVSTLLAPLTLLTSATAASAVMAPAPGPTPAPDAGRDHAPGPDLGPGLGSQGAAADLDGPPVLTTTTTGREDDGLLLTTPAPLALILGGAAIYDNSGEPVFWREGPYMNLQMIRFRGRPALSMWHENAQVGDEFIVLNSAYKQIASFHARGYGTDAHEFQVSPDGSRVLLLGFHTVTRDLSEHGGSAEAQVVNMVIQEQSVKTGKVRFEWSALDHIPITETQEPLTGDTVDYLHANSLAYDTDGNLLMVGRHTSTVYKINRSTGRVTWRLGGKSSDFTFPEPADRPSYQHDARRLPDGRLLLFDNGNLNSPRVSRGAVYDLDHTTMTARLVRDLRPDPPIFTEFAGSSRRTGNGDILLGFGSAGTTVEFRGTEPVFTASFPTGFFSYRSVRADWRATPAAPPAVTAGRPAADGSRELSMRWNGATELEAWRIEAGPTRRDLAATWTVDKAGMATRATVTPPAGTRVFRVSALDARGEVLATRTLDVEGGAGAALGRRSPVTIH